MSIEHALKFARLSVHEQWLLSEALLFLGLARLGTRLVPFRRLAPLFGRAGAESPPVLTPAQRMHARHVHWAVSIISGHTFWHNSCLVQAIAAQLMLKRRRVPSTLYLGMTKNETRELTAHAWVRSGQVILAGAPAHQRFTVVSAFAED